MPPRNVPFWQVYAIAFSVTIQTSLVRLVCLPMTDCIDEYRGSLHTRRHLAAAPIFKGIPDFRQTRSAMLRATTVEELTGILEECRERIKAIK